MERETEEYWVNQTYPGKENTCDTHTQISGMGSREASLGKWRNIYVHMYVCVYIYTYDMHA